MGSEVDKVFASASFKVGGQGLRYTWRVANEHVYKYET